MKADVKGFYRGNKCMHDIRDHVRQLTITAMPDETAWSRLLADLYVCLFVDGKGPQVAEAIRKIRETP